MKFKATLLSSVNEYARGHTTQIKRIVIIDFHR